MKRQTLTDFLQTHSLHQSLLFGFYGGGNYGDELLMEVLAGLLKKQGTKHVSIAYQTPKLYDQFHHDFGYDRVPMHNKLALLKSILRKKTIIVGGGGLWGMDANSNIFLMSVMLFASRWLLGKKVYLLEVGFYNSAGRLGRISAWCAAKAANAILARDKETYENFVRLQPNTWLDADIAWHINKLDLASYKNDLTQLETQLQVTDKTLFITLRRFRSEQQDALRSIVEDCLATNTDKPIIVALMEPRHVDPAGYRQLRSWQRQFPNLQIIDYGCNPLALFLFFRKHRKHLLFIGPQFHGILTAHLNGMPYLPLAYDNKVHNLLRTIAPHMLPISLKKLSAFEMQRFIDAHFSDIPHRPLLRDAEETHRVLTTTMQALVPEA
jgi:polysaccharide pyruvyl transferase WcaK-like protein